MRYSATLHVARDHETHRVAAANDLPGERHSECDAGSTRRRSTATAILIQADPPTNPAYRVVYDLERQRQWLERMQEFFGAFKLPMDITIKTTTCGVSNAWYAR